MVRQLVETPLIPPRRRMTYEEWQAWADEDVHSEWVDGEVIEFMTATDVHQRALLLFSALLMWYAEQNGLGVVLVSGVHLRIGKAEREPDIMFVAKQHLPRIAGTRIHGPADLVAEIVSDDSVERDTVVKFADYASLGVSEYWIFDPRPDQTWSKLYLLNEQGQYVEQFPDVNGRLWSRIVPGFWVDPTWMWDEARPALPVLVDLIVAG